VLTRLTAGKVHVCQASGGKLGGHPQGQVTFNEFAGPHPAGLAGTHIHFLEPVSLTKQVWHLNYQDVIAIGKLFTEGELCAERVIAIGRRLQSRVWCARCWGRISMNCCRVKQKR
jgi:Na+-transporting NADH:ubiquinone oxidoreductase subunit A